jgi:hypothetical protein
MQQYVELKSASRTNLSQYDRTQQRYGAFSLAEIFHNSVAESQSQAEESSQSQSQSQSTTANRNTPLAEFRKKLASERGEEEELEEGDEFMVLSTGRQRVQVPEKCPILRTDMKDPRRNSACGHIYSLEGAQSLLQGGGKDGRRRAALTQVPCPYPGCSKQIAEAYLQRDPELERALERMKKEKSRSQSEAFDV